MFEQITSTQNTKIKLIKRLRDKRGREREGLFTIDYERDLTRALDCGYTVEFALLCPALWTGDTALLDRLPQNAIYEVSSTLMEKAGYRQNPSGIVAVMQSKPTSAYRNTDAITTSRILGLVGLTKPGNIGALLRTADAAGFETILIIDVALDIYNPNIIRSSTGACFLGNIYQLTSREALAFLQSAQYHIISAHLDGNISLFDVDFTQKCAIFLGAEDTGLPDAWAQSCDTLLKIPMTGQLSDSLNVSVSGAIIMYEAMRQNNSH